MTLGFPLYTPESWNFIRLMEPDKNYIENYKNRCKNVLPTDMNVKQINTMLTAMISQERFCDGFFCGYIRSGDILKYLLRLDDLIKKFDL